MLPVKLRDIALLKCDFEVIEAEEHVGDSRIDAEPGAYAGVTDDQPLQLSVNTLPDEGEFVCLIEGKLEERHLPFRLSFEMGFLFGVPTDEPPPKVKEIQPTLVWIAFPHIREFIASMSGRSASPQYFLPPITRLPQPDEGSLGLGSDE
jgi:hypothetical protein